MIFYVLNTQFSLLFQGEADDFVICLGFEFHLEDRK